MDLPQNRKTVLLVEDDAALRLLLKEVMEQSNYGVVAATNGKEALDLYSKREVDLVVSDIFLPDLNGLELLSAAKSVSNTPFIFITGETEPNNLKGEGFLRKPFKSQELIQMMQEVLKGPTQSETISLERNFRPVALESIPTNSPYPDSLYIRLHAGKFIKISQPKEIFTAEQCKNLKTKGVQTLFKRKKEAE